MALVPPPVVTVTSTVPVPGGLVAVSLVGDTNVTPVAAFAPKLTVAVLVKLVPVMVTAVPPLGGPDEGDTPETVGTVSTVGWAAAGTAATPPSKPTAAAPRARTIATPRARILPAITVSPHRRSAA